MATSTIKFIDEIVSSGTSGDWTYRKWKSGKIEAWGTYSGSVACTVSSSAYGGYRSNATNISIPSGIFTAAPYVIGVKTNTNSFRIMNITPSSSTSATFLVGSGESTTATVNLALYAWQV